MAKKNYDQLAESLIENVGGKDNVTFLTHCVTRLRFNVKDQSKVNEEKLKNVQGVLGCQWISGQFQIIIGQQVNDVYEAICKKYDIAREDIIEENLDGYKNKNVLSRLLDSITSCIVPVIPVMVASGMIKVLLLLLSELHILETTSSTYNVLSIAGDAGFYFLPIFIGGTTAKKFGGNQLLGMLLGALLLHPNLIAGLANEGGMSIFGISIYNATYSSTIFPAIMSVFVMCKVEKLIVRFTPEILKSIIEPLGTFLIMIPLTLCIIGPAGAFIGVYFSEGIMWLYKNLGFVAVAFLACIYPLVVMTGMHTALVPYMLTSFSTIGYESIVYPAIALLNINQGIASLAIAVKTKNKNLKSTAASCAFTSIVGGCSEPALFGINLKLKKPLIGSMIGGLVGGIIAGAAKVSAYAFGNGGIFILPIFLSDDLMNLVWILVALIMGAITTFVYTYVTYDGIETLE